MNGTTTLSRYSQGDLTSSQRYARAIASLVLIFYTMLTNTPTLGLVALLPLIAIYPMFSAVVGWDPLRYVLNSSDSVGVNKAVARTGLVVIGAGLIAATMLAEIAPLGGLTILALVGILPIFVAIFGENPVAALFDSTQSTAEFSQYSDRKQDEIGANVVKYASRETQKASHQDHEHSHHEAA